ncbi:TetR/AcrR family transcriptional regulator [Glycomyces sp. A-F 0318]|uniref:TetR/AcrR family transcriptional regulator n=1 Tax=Glycomyces amatae TaxID=2881355 RepID=UPI001E5DA5DF|nr:TetR/AcrR family transcriptional regulator [Glycomyces amatae]MCD0445647.1 TetR/AcrR family transcriptional regulator [Glycomyces amatae]
MARPLGFRRDRVVEAATRTFLQHGLHAASAEELCRATGLGRSSLYNSFGSKDALFDECLGTYLDQTLERTETILGDTARPVRDRIAILLRRIAVEEAERVAAGEPRGCLAVNTVAELADDPEYAGSMRRVDEDTAARLRLLADALRVGQAAGEVTDAVSAEGLAAFVNAAIAGLRITSQGGTAAGRLDDIVVATLRALAP